MDTERLGRAIVDMGGGRTQLGQAIDTSVGIEMLVRLGDRVAKGYPLMQIFATASARSRGLRWLEDCITVGTDPPAAEPLIAERVTAGMPASNSLPRSPTMIVPEPVDTATRQQVIAQALEARSRAYAPYSKFAVGAALLASSGRVYTGVNVENASYGLTICAERVAISAAVAAGERSFAWLAIASPGGAAPCGACRQFAAEFVGDLPITLVDASGNAPPKETRLGQLLPGRFEFAPPKSD
jgi:cytidine deaminase